MLTIKNNFLKKEKAQELYKSFFDPHFPWYFQNTTAKRDTEEFYFQFTHLFYEYDKVNSDFFYLLDPLIKKIKMKKLRRVKANLTTMYHEVRPLKAHVDYTDTSKKARTGIYYINSNDGLTFFPKLKKEVKSVANRFVSFPVNTQHTGTTHTNEKIRIVINFNYFI